MEDEYHVSLEQNIMSTTWFDWICFFGTFCYCVYFVVVHIVADLPDDFLVKVKKKYQADQEERRGRIRDNG